MRRALLPLVAIFAVAVAAPASANHDKGGKKSYDINGKVKKLTKSRALDMLVFDLGQRAGSKMGPAKDATCKVSKRSATCSYRSVPGLNTALGIDGAYCVTDGKLTLKKSGKRFTVNQKARDC